MTKVCKGCGVSKPRTAFGKESRTRDGLRARCRECLSAQRAAWRESSREHLAAYYVTEAQRRKAYQAEWRRANPDRVRTYRQNSKTGTHDYLTQWRKLHAGVHADTQAP